MIKHLILIQILNVMGIKDLLLQWFISFLIKKFSGSVIKNENISSKELPEELHKPIIGKLRKRKVYSPFIDNIWGADLADMQLISKFHKGIRFLLCVNGILSKYARVTPLKDKKGITITNTFQKILDESNLKPSKIWVDKGGKFYNKSTKSWLEKNATEMFSIHNEQKSNVAEKIIRTLKNKFINTWVEYQKIFILIN